MCDYSAPPALIGICNPLRSPALIGICNPDVYNIRIFNPLIALQMLIFYACGLQIRTSAGLQIRTSAARAATGITIPC